MSATDDPASYESLAKDVFVYGSVSLALAMAKETNMIQCLCTAQSPLSSADMAAQLKLKERYVREVLNTLAAIGLIQLEEGTGGKEEQEARYWVPPTCRETLLAYSAFTLCISANARHYAGMRKCFNQNGPPGLRYDDFGFDLMDEIALVQGDSIVEAILQTPGLRERLEKGIKALEVGAGTGWLLLKFASLFPNSQFTITDPISQPVEQARKEAETKGLKNVTCRVLDIFHRPDDDLKDSSFDWISTVEVIHDLPFPLRGLQEIAKMLKPGGHYSLVDQFVPGHIRDNLNSKDAAGLYAMSTFMCVPESFQQAGSEALGACWGTEKAYELVKTAGMNVLGLTRSESLGTLAVCMCEKPE